MNAGVVTAYGAAKAGGYTGTYEQFCALMASVGAVRKIWTGVCETTESTAEKVVTLDDASGFTLTSGNTILVYCKRSNSADRPKLNVGGTGAKNIYYSDTSGVKTQLTTEDMAKWGVGLMIFTYFGGWVLRFVDSGRVRKLEKEKADKASPQFTGIPTAPTAASGTDTTQIATTAFVQTEVGNLERSINTELENLRIRVEGSALVIGSVEGE